MTCVLTCMFTLLQICLVPSKAMLFHPENLTVGLLDFKATVEWLPGQGNPPGTKYTLEFITVQNMSTGEWIRSPHCTNIAIPKCELTFDLQPDELFWNYFVRVKTTFRGKSSDWSTTSKTFQLYGDTRLSSPNLTISTDQKDISINFSHWLESKPGIGPLKFLLYLCWKSPKGESKCEFPKSTSSSSYTFPDVPSGRNYCVSVSASHQSTSKNHNFNTTKCISLLDSSTSSVIMMCIAAIVLLTFSTGIVVVFGCFYDTRLKIRKLRIPDALIIFPGNNCVLKLIPEEFQKIIQTWQKQLADNEDGVSVSEEDIEYAFQFYHQRENLEQAEAETSNQCYKYTSATYLELSEESVISEEEEDDHDDMHPVTPVSLCTSESSKFLEAATVNIFVNSEMDRYCAEETPCSSGNGCESEVPAEEEEEEEEEDDLLVYYSSENGYEYEPRLLR